MTDTNEGTLVERTAKLRTELRKAIKAGRITAWPDGAALSVRCDTASMYSCITIAVTATDDWAITETGLTPAARSLGDLLETWLAEYTGYAWGDVIINDRSAGHVSKAGWVPGED